MPPQLLVFHLSNPLSCQPRGCCFCLSAQLHSLCSGNPRGSECSPHGLANKPSPSDFFYEKQGFDPCILLTVLNKLRLLQTFALIWIFSYVFPWMHRQFQQNGLLCCRRSDDYIGSLVCDCYLWWEFHSFTSFLSHNIIFYCIFVTLNSSYGFKR